MTVNQMAEQLAAKLQASVADGKLALTNTSIETLPIGELLSLLDLQTLTFAGVAITQIDNSVTIAGKTSLLQATEVGMTATVRFEETTTFEVSAQVSHCRVPGAAWLTMQDAQIGLRIKGRAEEVEGRIEGKIQVHEQEFSTALIVAKTGDDLVFQWTIEQIDLSTIAASFLDGASLPPELPNLAFEKVETIIKPKSREFSFQAISGTALHFPADGEFSITETEVKLERVAATEPGSSSQINCNIRISGEEPITIVNELILKKFHFEFNLDGKDWKVSGDVEADVCEKSLALAATYSQTPEEKRLNLSIESELALIDLESVGQFGISRLELEWLKQAASEPGQPATSDWSLSADGAIVITDAIDMAGNLKIYKQGAEEAGLVFKPDHATVTLPLPPDKSASMQLAFGDISLISTVTTTNQRQWSFEAAVAVEFQGLNKLVQKHLPKPISLTFQADKTGAKLAIARLAEPIEFKIPDVALTADKTLALGTAVIDLSDLEIRLGKVNALSVNLGVGLPSQLNTLFGTQTDGTPSMEFFRTYKADDPSSIVQLKLSITELGIKLTPETSFIKAIEVVTEDGKSRWHGDFGEYGAIAVDVPDFTYSATSTAFTVSGGFDILRPLALPLAPIKQLLDACHLSGAAKMLPDSLPLTDVKIDSTNLVDNLVEMLKPLLQKLGSGKLSDEARTVLDTIAQNFHKLPTSFTDYLDVQIPQSLHFNVAVTPEGTVRFDISVDKERPIKLLFPGLMLAMPVLNGITLRSISFGETAGGSLFLLKVDADLDQFDLATLAAALVLPESPNSPLPNVQSLHRRLKLNELYMVLPTAFPVPIPLFYENVGIEYLGLEGLTFETHAQFPMPSPSLKDVGELLSTIKQFFTDRDYLLDPQKPLAGLNPNIFSLNKNYIQLPQYLGGKTLGAPDKGPALTYANVASLLNGMKTLSPNQLIQALPLEYRVGNEQVTFGCAQVNAAWLVTTPAEFKQGAYRQLNLSSADSLMLPAVSNPANNEDGIVVFLKGGWNVPNVTTFDVAFGLAASGTMGFNTGFRMAGKLANLIDVELKGMVAVKGQPAPDAPFDPKAIANPATPAFQLAGSSRLSIPVLKPEPIFAGNVQLIGDQFSCKGHLNLFPKTSPIQVNGDITGYVDGQSYHFEGAVNTALAGVNLVDALALIANDRVLVKGSWLGSKTSLTLQTNNGAWSLTGQASFNVPSLSLDLGSINKVIGANTVKLTNSLNITVAANAALDITLSNTGFSAVVKGSFTLNGQQPSFGPFSITIAPQDINALWNLVIQQIKAQAVACFDILYPTAKAWLQKVKSSLELSFAEIGRGLKYAYNQTPAQALGLLKEVGYSLADACRVLKDGFNQGAAEVASLLISAGSSLEETARVLKDVFNQSVEDVARLFLNLGYSIVDAARTLKSVFNQGAEDTARLFLRLGRSLTEVAGLLRDVFSYGPEDIARLFVNLGKSVTDIASVLKNLGYSATDAGSVLRNLGYSITDVAVVLRDVFGQNITNIATVLRNLGYSATDTGSVLRSLGYSIGDVAGVLRNVFGQSFADIASALKGWGYSLLDIAKVLKNTFSLGYSDIYDLLRGLKFSRLDIIKALKKLFS